MAEFPALPLWTDAWVADTHHLSIFARGLYFDLLVLMWRTPSCRVPNDRAWLIARLRISESDFDNVLTPLIKELCKRNAGGWITQKRLTREFAYVLQNREKNRAAAKVRWEKEKDLCKRNAPTPTPQIVEGRDKSLPSFDHFEAFWSEVPRKVGKGHARRAYATALKTTSHSALLEGMRRYAVSRVGEDDQYTAHPATWLNGQRWLDEPPAEGKPNGRRNGKAPTAHDNFFAAAEALIRRELETPDESGDDADAVAIGPPVLPA